MTIKFSSYIRLSEIIDLMQKWLSFISVVWSSFLKR